MDVVANPLERDATRCQIDPEALSIIESTGHVVLPGKRDVAKRDLSPLWPGLTNQWWDELARNNPKAFYRLVEISEEDFPTFCAIKLKVYNKTVARTHPFIFNQAQQIIWNTRVRLITDLLTVFLVVLKARQLGVSTYFLAEQMWHAWRERDVATTIITHEKKLAETMVRTISLFYDEMPQHDYIKPKLRQQNRSANVPKHELFFSSRGGREWRAQISTHVATNLEARGSRAKHILQSEKAFYKDPKPLDDAIMPQLPPIGSPARRDCSFTVESTPNGQNHFYDLWQLAKSGKSEWTPIWLPWTIADDLYFVEPPDHWRMNKEEISLQKKLSVERKKIDGKNVSRGQMYWRRLEIDSKADNVQDAEMAFEMEYPSDDEMCFLLYQNESLFKDDMRFLGASVAESEKQARQMCKTQGWPIGDSVRGDLEFAQPLSPFSGAHAFILPSRPKFHPGRQGRLTIWEEPRLGHVYTIGSDAGDTNDNAVSQVICVKCAAQAAELVLHGEGPEVFTDHTVALGRWYHNALWLPEINHVGTVVMKRGLTTHNYPNMAREEKWDEVALKKNKYGWSTSQNNKPVLISNLKMMISERYVRIASRVLRSELSTFHFDGLSSRDNPMYSASGRNHDDTVIAFALALMAVRQSPKMFSDITKQRHETPTAEQLGLNHTSDLDPLQDIIPKQLQNLLDLSDSYVAPFNPIRGGLGGFF